MSWGTPWSWLSSASLNALPAGPVTVGVAHAMPLAVTTTSASIAAALGGAAAEPAAPLAGGAPDAPAAPGGAAGAFPEPMGRTFDATTAATAMMATIAMNVGTGQRGAGPLSM